MPVVLLTRLLAFWGMLAVVLPGLYVLNLWPSAWLRQGFDRGISEGNGVATIRCPACPPVARISAPRDAGTVTTFPGALAQRYSLCTSSALPNLNAFTLSQTPALGVHCGGTAHVLRLDGEHPVRQLDFTIKTGKPNTNPHPGPVALIRNPAGAGKHLIISTPYVDSHATARSGSLHILRRQSRGGFAKPQHWLSIHARKLWDGSDAAQLALHLGHQRNRHHGYGPEFWSYRPGVFPPKTAYSHLPLGAHILGPFPASPNLLIVAGEQDEQKGIWLWDMAQPPAEAQTFFAIGEIAESAFGDLNADGIPDVLLGGHALFTFDGNVPSSPPRRVEGSSCPTRVDTRPRTCHRDVQIVDIDGDGRPDLKSYQHPYVSTWKNLKPFQFSHPPTQQRLAGPEVSILRTHWVHLKGSNLPEALFLLTASGADSSIELAMIVDLDPSSTELRFEADVQAIAAAPLHTQDALRPNSSLPAE